MHNGFFIACRPATRRGIGWFRKATPGYHVTDNKISVDILIVLE